MFVALLWICNRNDRVLRHIPLCFNKFMEGPTNWMILEAFGRSDTMSEVFGNEVPIMVFVAKKRKFQTYNTQNWAFRCVMAIRCESRWSRIRNGFRQWKRRRGTRLCLPKPWTPKRMQLLQNLWAKSSLVGWGRGCSNDAKYIGRVYQGL